MANQYDTNLKLQAIADAIGDSQSSGLISALEDIADAVAGGGGGGSSTAGLVSDNFSETDTYDMGDYCIHNNTLYVCINAITTPGPWDLSDWQATNSGIQLSSLNSALTAQKVKRSSVNGTTDANGVLWTSLSVNSKQILSAWLDAGGGTDRFIFIGVKSGIYGFMATNSAFGKASGQNVTIYYEYVDIV